MACPFPRDCVSRGARSVFLLQLDQIRLDTSAIVREATLIEASCGALESLSDGGRSAGCGITAGPGHLPQTAAEVAIQAG